MQLKEIMYSLICMKARQKSGFILKSKNKTKNEISSSSDQGQAHTLPSGCIHVRLIFHKNVEFCILMDDVRILFFFVL
jgi:hypothetical protein